MGAILRFLKPFIWSLKTSSTGFFIFPIRFKQKFANHLSANHAHFIWKNHGKINNYFPWRGYGGKGVPPHPELPNQLITSKCLESRAILILFRMSWITRTLFEKIMGKKLMIFQGRGTGGGFPSIENSMKIMNF